MSGRRTSTHEAAKAIGEWLEGKRRPAPANPLFDHARSRGDGAERHQPFHRRRRRSGLRSSPNDPASQKLSMLLGSEALRGLQPRGARLLLHALASTEPLSDLRLLLASAACEAGAAIAKRNFGMIDKTAMETQRHQGGAAAPCGGPHRARPDGAVPRPHRRGDRPHHRGVRRWTFSDVDAAPGAQRRYSVLRSAR